MVKRIKLTSTPQLLIGSEADTEYAVTEIFVSNAGNEADSVDIYIVPKGEIISNENKCFIALPVETGAVTMPLLSNRIILSDGDAIYASSSKGLCTTFTSVMKML